MTCREKLKLEHPEYVASDHGGGCFQCPSSYGYLDDPSWCDDCVVEKPGDCWACWDREIPEEKSDTQKSITPELDAFRDALTNTPVINFGLSKETFSNNNFKPKYPPHILDSGNRREFETGAVRDIQEGKGRCDLMPLDVMGVHFEDSILLFLGQFISNGNPGHLYRVLDEVPSRLNFACRPSMYLEVSKHFEEGAKKYGERNWQKGIPTHCYIDSAVRHYLKYLRGDNDEPHDRAFVWNILCCIWTCKHKPELNDYAKEDGKEAER